MRQHFILFFIELFWRVYLESLEVAMQCIVSYLPKVTEVMMVGASSCSVMYWGGLLVGQLVVQDVVRLVEG